MALGLFEVAVSRNVFDCDDISVYLLIRLGLVSLSFVLSGLMNYATAGFCFRR